jgi:hypothetical protein
VRYLAATQQAERNLPPGSAIEHSFNAPREREAYVGRPDGRTDRVTMAVRDGSGVAIYADTDLAGRYVVRTAGQPGADYVIQSDDGESDLTLLEDDALDALCNDASAKRVAAAALAEAVTSGRAAQEWSLAVLAIVMLALGGELMLATRAGAVAGPTAGTA